jgi:16S rRNA (uracil1498-N3)-methyltransferase
MADPRALVPPGAIAVGARVELDPAEGRHVVVVLRRRVGDEVEVLDGSGMSATARIDEIRRHRVVLEIATVSRHAGPPRPATHLALAVLHTDAMDWAVQKAVELGVERLIPVLAARSQAGSRAVSRRAEHWRRVAGQALKQCGRPWRLELETPRTVSELVSDPPPSPLVASADGCRMIDVPPPSGDVTLVVGPEGGFDDDELAVLRGTGWPAVRLGDYTLRSETAASAGVTAVRTLREASSDRRG